MRPKSGLPKRKALRATPVFTVGLKDTQEATSFLNPQSEPIPVLSMFAGCGGLDLGFQGGFSVLGRRFERNGFQIVEAIDNDAKAIDAYKLNIGSHARVADLTEVDVSTLPSCRVLLGGFPCQDFSSSGPKVGFAGARGMLYRVMVDYAEKHRPELIIGENVPHLRRLDGGKYLKAILEDFSAIGYDFNVWELHCPDYGLPQSRRRLILVGVRSDIGGSPLCPIPSHSARHLAIDEALVDLEEIADETVTNQSQYFVATKATAGGGQGDHTNKRGEVAYCIRANAKARIQFHYSLERRLTVRECARLQSFPDQFVFPFSAMINMTHIGNAVPPLIGHAVAQSVERFLRALDRGEKPAQDSSRAVATQVGLFDREARQ